VYSGRQTRSDGVRKAIKWGVSAKKGVVTMATIGMMEGMGWGMGLGMGLFGLLVAIVLVLAAAALVKYLFFEGRSGKSDT